MTSDVTPLQLEVVPGMGAAGDRLRYLADKINAEHRRCAEEWAQVQQGAHRTIERAAEIGAALNEAHGAVGKRKFSAWLRDNCPAVQRSQAYLYMRIAAGVAEGKLDLCASGQMSINAASQLLAGGANRKRQQEGGGDSEDPFEVHGLAVLPRARYRRTLLAVNGGLSRLLDPNGDADSDVLAPLLARVVIEIKSASEREQLLTDLDWYATLLSDVVAKARRAVKA